MQKTIVLLIVIAIFYTFQNPFPDLPIHRDSNEYSKVKAQLSELSDFFEKERKRVAVTEQKLTKLNAEKDKLEPIVLTQRKTVNEILEVYSAKEATRAWKERLIGFILGTLASIVATMIYNHFKV